MRSLDSVNVSGDGKPPFWSSAEGESQKAMTPAMCHEDGKGYAYKQTLGYHLFFSTGRNAAAFVLRQAVKPPLMSPSSDEIKLKTLFFTVLNCTKDKSGDRRRE